MLLFTILTLYMSIQEYHNLKKTWKVHTIQAYRPVIKYVLCTDRLSVGCQVCIELSSDMNTCHIESSIFAVEKMQTQKLKKRRKTAKKYVWSEKIPALTCELWNDINFIRLIDQFVLNPIILATNSRVAKKCF